MKINNVEFNTYFKNYPDENGYFGKYGGSYIPTELQTAMKEINEAYQTICKSSKFISDREYEAACLGRVSDETLF